MGTHINKSNIHLEFYGLPGCGKTTVSRIVASKLRENGFQVEEPSYNTGINKNPITRRIKKLFYLLTYIVRYPQSTRLIISIVSKNQYRWFSKFLQFLNVIQKVSKYDNKAPYILVWDEGIIQAAISLSLNGHINSPQNENDLTSIIRNAKIIKIYLYTGIEIAKDRIASRKKGHSRIEKEKDSVKRQALLERFYNQCEQITPTCKIDVTELSPDMTASIIVNQISEILDCYR